MEDLRRTRFGQSPYHYEGTWLSQYTATNAVLMHLNPFQGPTTNKLATVLMTSCLWSARNLTYDGAAVQVGRHTNLQNSIRKYKIKTHVSVP